MGYWTTKKYNRLDVLAILVIAAIISTALDYFVG